MRVVRTIGAALTVAALVVITPLSASAAEVVPSASSPDFIPSGSKWKEYMLNITGKVLGGAMPSKWKAEQLANQYKYDFSWEKFEVDHGFSAANKDFVTNPNTYDDYVLRDLETRKANGGPKTGKGKAFKPPATKAGKLFKVVNGVVTPLIAFDVAASLTQITGLQDLAAGWFGIDDVTGAVCGNTGDDVLGGMAQYVSGVDCAPWRLDPEFVPNGDASAIYDLRLGAWYRTYTGVALNNGVPRYLCFTGSGLGGDPPYLPTVPLPVGYTVQKLTARGAWVNAQLETPHTTTLCGGAKYSAYADEAPGVNLDAPVGPGAFRLLGPDSAVVEMEAQHDDPERRMSCTINFTGGGSASLDGQPYHESDGRVWPAECPSIPEGETVESVTMDETQQGGATQRVYDQPTTPEYQEFVGTYPECQWGNCKLDLIVKTGTHPASCFDLEDGCAGWFEDPNKATSYQCRYGTNDVDLEECAIYSGLFEPGRLESGAAYSDPATGTWSGGQSSPKSGDRAMANTVQDPELLRSCDMSGLGFDPVGWVLRPVQCAMEWAFAPRPTVVEVAFAGADDAWEGKPPAVIAAAAESLALTPSASGCSKSVSLFGAEFNIIDACSGPMAQVADISRLVTGFGMVVLVLVVLKRQIAGMVGYNQGQG